MWGGLLALGWAGTAGITGATGDTGWVDPPAGVLPAHWWTFEGLHTVGGVQPDRLGGRRARFPDLSHGPGALGEGLALDGVGAVDLGGAFTPSGAFTVSVWVWPEAGTTERFVVGRWADCGASPDARQWSLSLLPSGRLRVRFATPDGSAQLEGDVAGPLPVGAWSQVAVAWDGAGLTPDARVQVWIDGQPRAVRFAATGGPFTLAEVDAHLSMGRPVAADGGACGVGLVGGVDELALTDRALDTTEVRAAFDLAVAGEPLAPLAPVLDLVLVLDRSCSMNGPGEIGVGDAQEAFAARALADHGPLDRIGATWFSNHSGQWQPFTWVSPETAAGWSSTAWQTFCCSGTTDPGAGVALARTLLAGSFADQRVIVLVTDGVPNPTPLEVELAEQTRAAWEDEGIHVYTIGFGAIDSELMYKSSRGLGRPGSVAAWQARFQAPSADGVQAIISGIQDELR